MDDAIDQMQKTAKAVVLFEITDFAPQMRSVSNGIGECSEFVQGRALLANIGQHAGRLNEIRLQISRIEGRADETYDDGLKQLYQRAKSGNTMEFVHSNEITTISRRVSIVSTTSPIKYKASSSTHV